MKKPLIILLCAVACMLLIGCLNVANLMVARSAARQKEIAIRSALGARRMTLIREQLMESLLVSHCRRRGRSAVIAGGNEVAGQHVEGSSQRAEYPRRRRSAGIRLRARLCSGPAGGPAAGDLIDRQRSGSRRCRLRRGARQAARSRTALRKTLLTVEIATTVVLLIAAGLLLKSFWRLRTTDVGCATDNVLTMGYSLPAKKYDSPEKVNAFNETLLERVRAMPGVRAAALGSIVPGAGAAGDDSFTIPEHPPIAPGTALPDALSRLADPGYFSDIADTAVERALLYQRGSSRPSEDDHHQPPAGAAIFPRGKSAGQASPRRCAR